MYDQNEGLGAAMTLAGIEGKADDAKRRIDALEQRIAALEHRLDQSENKIGVAL